MYVVVFIILFILSLFCCYVVITNDMLQLKGSILINKFEHMIIQIPLSGSLTLGTKIKSFELYFALFLWPLKCSSVVFRIQTTACLLLYTSGATSAPLKCSVHQPVPASSVIPIKTCSLLLFLSVPAFLGPDKNKTVTKYVRNVGHWKLKPRENSLFCLTNSASVITNPD